MRWPSHPRSSGRRARDVVVVAALLAPTLVTPACLYTDAQVPSSAKLLCASSTDCPTGWTCEVDVGLCLSPDAPRLDGPAVLTPTVAGPVQEARLSFRFDREVADDAVEVALVDGTGTPLSAAQWTRADGGPDFAFTLRPQDVSDGEYRVEITATSAEDATGRFFAGPLVVDASVPGFRIVDGAPVSYVAPPLVNDAATVVGGFTADEVLGGPDDGHDAPRFRVVAPDGAVALVDGTLLGGAEASFELAPDPGRAEGEHAVFVDRFVDRAGNAALFYDEEEQRIGAFVLDRTPPALAFVDVAPATVSPVGDDHVVTVCVDVTDPHLKTGALDGPAELRPFTLTLADIDVTARCAPSAAPCSHTCVVDVATDVEGAVVPEEGPVLLALLATDRAGNTRTAGAAVVWDERAPAVANPVASIEPGPENVLRAPRALTNASTLFVAFNTSEAVPGSGDDPPAPDPTVVLECGGAALPLTRDAPLASTFFLYHHTLTADDDAPDGPCAVQVTLADRTGNVGTATILDDGTVRLDRTAPSTELLDGDALVHVRAPWGVAGFEAIEPGQSYTLPFHTVVDTSGADPIPYDVFAAPGEDIALVRVWDLDDGGAEIGRAPRATMEDPEHPGETIPVDPPAFAITAFQTRDAPMIWVSIVDDAGNDSARVRVEHGQWIATTGSAATWALNDNPTALVATPTMSSALFPPSSAIYRYPDPILDPSEADPGAGVGGATARAALVELPGAASFERLRQAGDPTPFPVDDPMVAVNPVVDRIYVFGGQRAGVMTNHLWELDGPRAQERCVSVLDPCRWTRPAARLGAAMLYDPVRARTLVVGGCVEKGDGIATACEPTSEVFKFDGEAFETACGNSGCPPAFARHRQAAAVDDDGRLFVFGGCLDRDCTTLSDGVLFLDDDGVQTACDELDLVPCLGTPPAPRADAAMFVDGGTLHVVGGCAAYATGAPDWTCADPRVDHYSLDIVGRTWTKHGNVEGATSCARARLTDVYRAPLDGIAPDDAPARILACGDAGSPPTVHRYDDSSFIEVTLAAGSDVPADGAHLALTTDPARDRAVLFSSSFAAALTLVDGATAVAGAYLADVTVTPTNTADRALAPTASGNVVYVADTGGATSTWEWNGARWRPRCTGCTPTAVTPALALVDTGAAVAPLLVAGGNLWRYDEDLPGDPWVPSGGAAPLLTGPRLVTLASGAGLLLGTLGGAQRAYLVGAGGLQSLDTTASTMPARFAPGAALSVPDGGALVFGGCAAPPCDPLGDTWLARPEGGTLVTSEVASTAGVRARGAPILVVEPYRDVPVMFGGVDGLDAVDDGAWELLDGDWVARTIVDPEGDGAPDTIVRGSGAPDHRGGGVLFTSDVAAVGAADVWRYDGHASSRPGHVYLVPFIAAGVPSTTSLELVFVRWVGGGSSGPGNGVRVLGWRRDHWAEIGSGAGTSAALDDALGLIDPATTGDDPARYVFDPTQLLAFALVPGPNIGGVARLTSAYVEVHIRYRLPAAGND